MILMGENQSYQLQNFIFADPRTRAQYAGNTSANN
jgi:hypothetical protein